mmetsp:Transcript_17136/g.25691  ORF Transcript_17136/g.25691 Transcript_17136/m.25691 type:complete len:96 (-) Transcript_17136:71-358(-)
MQYIIEWSEELRATPLTTNLRELYAASLCKATYQFARSVDYNGEWEAGMLKMAIAEANAWTKATPDKSSKLTSEESTSFSNLTFALSKLGLKAET